MIVQKGSFLAAVCGGCWVDYLFQERGLLADVTLAIALALSP